MPLILPRIPALLWTVNAMATPFMRTLRALNRDRIAPSFAGIAAAGLLLAAWSWWMWRAEIPRYEVTANARLEAGRAIHVLQAPFTGRVVATRLELDATVTAGDILVELDANPEKLQIHEEKTRAEAITPQIRAIEAEIATLRQAGQREREATAAAVSEARGRLREAESVARHASSEEQRLARLHSDGLIPRRDYDQGKTEAETRAAAVETFRLSLSRLESEQRTRDTDREAGIRRLQGELSRLRGEQSTSVAAVRRLDYDVERRRIRAPISGRLGEVTILRVGGVVTEGQKLGTVVPDGTLRAVAEFPPASAVGRIRPRQPARLRLDGFPWAQYGSIQAIVEHVGSEVRDGTVRVELSIAPHGNTPIPLQHGLPGSVEVEVERESPANLLLRAAGAWLAAPRSIFISEAGAP
jgi:membrane fusion protein (multidrug efflux system)